MSEPSNELTPAQAEAAVRAQLDAWVADAVRLRQHALPPPTAPPDAFYRKLLEVRAGLDALEEVLSQAMALRGGLRRRARELDEAAEDAWDKASRELRRSGRMDQYTAGRERAGECNLATFDLRRTARAAALLANVADEAVDRVRLKHRGLGDLRQELLAVLRHQQWESSLDR